MADERVPRSVTAAADGSDISSSEQDRVAMLAEIFSVAPSVADIVLGIGDDAALVQNPGNTLVWSVDAQVENVHFRRGWMSFEDIGFRATMAASSDLAAMGARPLGVLSALILPRDLSDADLRAIATGQRAAVDALGTSIVGGNMARGDTLSITTTVLGAADAPVRRTGASVRDRVWLAGHVGRAACGLALRLRGVAVVGDSERIADEAFRRPVALLAQGLSAAPLATAMIDLSDGLSTDLGRLARDSKVAIALDESALEDVVVAGVAKRLGLDALERILQGGEDYALVATAAPRSALPGFRVIGRVLDDRTEGIWLDDGKTLRRIEELGFDHFT